MAEQLFEKHMVGLHAEIELDLGYGFHWLHRHGDKDYWQKYEEAMNREANDLEEFIRDHRSRDHYGISIVREYRDVCKFCGYEYPDGFNGIADCCQEMLDAQGIKFAEE